MVSFNLQVNIIQNDSWKEDFHSEKPEFVFNFVYLWDLVCSLTILVKEISIV